LRSARNEDKPVKLRSSSTSDLPKKIVSPERTLVLPPVFDTDKFEALSVQLETVRLNGVCTIDLLKTLMDTVHKLSEVVAILKSDNASLKTQISQLNCKVDIPQGSCPPVLVSGQTRLPLIQPKPPTIGILPGANLLLLFPVRRILQHLRRNQLIVSLPWTPGQLFHYLGLHIRFLLCKSILMVLQLSATTKKANYGYLNSKYE
jgi:hypothetical protein